MAVLKSKVSSLQTAKDCMAALAKYADKERATQAARFFKTGKGGYSEGDQFLGATVPNTRIVCKQFKDLPLPEVQKLLDSPIHDHRLAAVIILADRYKRADTAARDQIFELYLKNVYAGRINNWDIVDTSAAFIVGPHEEETNRALLFDLAQSGDVWHRRVAILSAMHYLKQGDADTTFALAEVLLYDQRDLIQKAVGWQLREAGKRVSRQKLLQFLDKHAATMPRTALRYAIEHLTPDQKARYMKMKYIQSP